MGSYDVILDLCMSNNVQYQQLYRNLLSYHIYLLLVSKVVGLTTLALTLRNVRIPSAAEALSSKHTKNLLGVASVDDMHAPTKRPAKWTAPFAFWPQVYFQQQVSLITQARRHAVETSKALAAV